MKRSRLAVVLASLLTVLLAAAAASGYAPGTGYSWNSSVPGYNASAIIHPDTIRTDTLNFADFLGRSASLPGAAGWGDSGASVGWDDNWIGGVGNANTNGDHLDGLWSQIVYGQGGWWDLGSPADQVVVFTSQDHGSYLGEGLEYRIYGTNTLWSNSGLSSQGVVTDVYLDGWRPHNSAEDRNRNGWQSDDISAVVQLPGKFRYIRLDAWANYNAWNEPEVDAIATFGETCVEPPPGMISWWRGEGNPADSADGNDGSPAGGVSYVQGKVGQAFRFDGSTGRVNVNDSENLKIVDMLSIEGWVFLEHYPSSMHGQILFRGDNRSGWDPYYLAIQPNGVVRFVAGYLVETSPIPLGRYVHVAAVFNGTEGTGRIYLNGSLAAEQRGAPTTLLRDLDPAYDPHVGIGNHGGSLHNQPFPGIIDELAIYNRALTQDEINGIYYAGSAGKCPNQPPVADAGPDRTIECAGPNGTTVTLDGSGSSDPDGDALAYAWTWNGGTASGVSPTVTLPPGTHAITLTVDDGKGGTAADTVTIAVRDTTPPVTTVRSIAGVSGSSGWYTSDVLITVDSMDSCSGVRDIGSSIDGNAATTPGGTATIPVQGDGSHVVTFGATDNAGNVEQPKSLVITIDKTPPVITASVSPSANADGWHNSDVTVTFACSDALSGIASCTDPVTVTTEGAGQVVTGTAVDKAGNTATASVTLNIDKTAPTVDISVTPGLLWPPNHKMVDVAVNGGSSDNTSGVASVVITVTDEYGIVQPVISGFNTTVPLEAWREGTDRDGRHYTITATITDAAGNTTVVSTEAVCPHDMRGR